MNTHSENLDSHFSDRKNENLRQGAVSKQEWQRWEQLLDQTPSEASSRSHRKKRDQRVFLGGVMATLTLVTVCYLGINQPVGSTVLSLLAPASALVNPFVSGTALSAQKSILTGIVDRDTLTASLYWTLDLKNSSGTDGEAQAELRLPEGGVVSRATLWVNGVPQEAAFNTTAQVTNAYNWIAVQHRDPLLVTYKDARTVVIKASPVPAGGAIMQVRLGITAPLTVAEDGKALLTIPEIKEANFSLPEKNDINIESKQVIESSNSLLNQEQAPSGKYILKANLLTRDLAKLAIISYGAQTQGDFAIRATHSLPGTYIYSRANADSDDQINELDRSQSAPQCRVVKSEQAAYRVSTLWASREVSRLLAKGQRREAEDVASAFRIVSPVSGAVVMELDSDYQRMRLHRNQYMVNIPGKSLSSSQSQDNRPELVGMTMGNVLVGATNGTIAPQGHDSTVLLQGAISPEATSVVGVNTAGTVRDTNLANSEACLTIAANACNLGFFIAAVYFTLCGLLKTISAGLKAGVKDQLIAISLVACGTLWLMLLPLMAGFKIVQYAGRKWKASHAT